MATKTWDGSDSGNEGDYGTNANWKEGTIPGGGDDVRIPATSSQSITGSLDQSGVAIGDFIVEDGYTGTIGTSAADLKIDPNRFEFAGGGVSYIDIGSAAIAITITKTASTSTGLRGLYLIGSAISTANIIGGSVGLAAVHGTTATVTTIRISGSTADVWIGEGCTVTTVEQHSGLGKQRAASTTTKVFGGTMTTEEEGTITTLQMEGGTAVLNSTGTITTVTGNGGTADLSQSHASRTITTLNPNPGFTISYDPNSVTVTNFNDHTVPARINFLSM